MRTIYLLEDNPIISKVIDKTLSKADCSCRVFSRGDLLKEALEENPPNLIICDIMVPGLTGLDIARYSKSTPTLAALPIIILTAMTDQKYRAEAEEIGVDLYITKDKLVLSELVDNINTLLLQ